MARHSISVPGLAVGLAFIALLVPLLIVGVPPVLDYPNHFARMWLIAGGAQLTPLNQMYAVDWSQASTNIGIDLLAQTFGRLLGAGAVAKTCLMASIVLPCLGCLLLHRKVFGGAHWWQLVFVYPAFGKTGLAGFMNFNIGVGLALIGAVIDDALGPVEIWDSRIELGVIQALDGTLCIDRRPMGENATPLLGQAD